MKTSVSIVSRKTIHAAATLDGRIERTEGKARWHRDSRAADFQYSQEVGIR